MKKTRETLTMSREEAQGCFRDVHDGDYAFFDLVHRSPEVMRAVIALHAAHISSESPADPQPKTRIVTFQSDTGEIKLKRPVAPRAVVKTRSLDDVVVTVQNGRVTGFSKG